MGKYLLKCRDNKIPGVSFIKKLIGLLFPGIEVRSGEKDDCVGLNRLVSIREQVRGMVCISAYQKYQYKR